MLLVSIIVLSVLGILFGIALSFASKVFHVEIDPKIEQIEEVLPGANCGACAYAGCAGYAEAIVLSGAEPTLCAPGGDAVAAEIAKIMGTKAGKKERNIAVIHCQSGGINNTNIKFENKGIATCKAAVLLSNGQNACTYGCLGYN
ncbi:MAG TPA: RnfABCDGE type electron transport complex subunit B, partial [Candidatus Cloacimonetes bacterium]|nr:RnfABCDGE type electron transport complex subunit B [Candidatus Cloacimonadota bacterium]